VSANGSVRLCSCPTAIEAGIPRGVLIIIAPHTPLPTWVKSRIPPERSHVSFRQLLRTYQRTRVQQLCARAAVSRCSDPVHSITASAVASSLSGTVSPSILAVAALMASSNFDACTTGRSAGFAPLRMRPV
jgi:hypothetical protein